MAGLRPRSRTERGVILAFATAAISGLSIYLNFNVPTYDVAMREFGFTPNSP